MSDFGLFVGWGAVRAGQQANANKVFGEAVAYWESLKAAGTIESYETVVLGYHGGDLAGYFLVRGDPAGLPALSMSPEFQRLTSRAAAVVESLGVIPAALDAQAARRVAESFEAIGDLI